jgi:hypothetical protein
MTWFEMSASHKVSMEILVILTKQTSYSGFCATLPFHGRPKTKLILSLNVTICYDMRAYITT